MKHQLTPGSFMARIRTWWRRLTGGTRMVGFSRRRLGAGHENCNANDSCYKPVCAATPHPQGRISTGPGFSVAVVPGPHGAVLHLHRELDRRFIRGCAQGAPAAHVELRAMQHALDGARCGIKLARRELEVLVG